MAGTVHPRLSDHLPVMVHLESVQIREFVQISEIHPKINVNIPLYYDNASL